MANSRRIIFNTRERLLSGDINTGTTLLLANDADNAVAGMVGSLFVSNSAALRRSGIVAGGTVTASGSLIVTVRRMLGYKYTASPPTAYDSAWQVVQTNASIQVDLTALVDPANPRWVAIEAAPGDVAELVSVRDIFQPALGTFTTAPVDKIRAPEAVITVNAGAASPTPVLPAGLPGVIPLAYVYIPASAVSLTSANLISCKPVLGKDGTLGPLWRGGGVDVVAPAGGSVVTLKDAQFRSDYFATYIQVPEAGTCDADIATHPNWVTGQSYPAGQQPIYVYVAAAPYPAGYDLDVVYQREFLGGGVQFIPSVDINAGVLNGLVVFSNDPPNYSSPIGSWGGGPALGLNDATWNGGLSPATFYLGTVSKQNNGTPGLALQATLGPKVRMLENDKICRDFSATGAPVASGSGDFRNQSPLGLNAAGKGTAVVLPDADLWDINVEDDNQALATDYYQRIYSALDPQLDSPLTGAWAVTEANSAGDAYQRRSLVEIAAPAGAFDWTNGVNGTGATRMRVLVRGYTDRTLSLR